MTFYIADTMNPCPLCNLFITDIPNGCAFLEEGQELEYKIRFCPICGKEFLSEEEWLKVNKERYLKDKEQGRNVKLYSEYNKENK